MNRVAQEATGRRTEEDNIYEGIKVVLFLSACGHVVSLGIIILLVIF